MRHLPTLLLSLALLPAFTPLFAGEPDAEKDTPFAKVVYPSVASPGEEVELHVTVKGSELTDPVDLIVDMHAILGAGEERKTGLGTARFLATPGEDSTFVAAFKIPDVENMTRIAFPVFITPQGKGWAEKLQNTEVASKIQ